MDEVKVYTNRKNIVLLATLCCFLWGSAYPAIKVGYSLFNISDVGSKLILQDIGLRLQVFLYSYLSLYQKELYSNLLESNLVR